MPVKNLFGTSGIRGKTKTEITPDFAFKLGWALAYWLGRGKTVAVGRDNRPGADKLSQAVKQGMVKAGAKVTDYGILPTPELSFHLVRTKADAGVMVTGSHLPIDMLGIIPLFKDGSGIYGSAGAAITKIYEQKSPNLPE